MNYELKPALLQGVRLVLGTENNSRSSTQTVSQNSIDIGSPPCSPQIPIFNFGFTDRPPVHPI